MRHLPNGLKTVVVVTLFAVWLVNVTMYLKRHQPPDLLLAAFLVLGVIVVLDDDTWRERVVRYRKALAIGVPLVLVFSYALGLALRRAGV
jgi:hypothetical protein